MKILVLPSWYPSESYPNNGIFFKEQVEALAKSGLDVDVLCLDIPYRKTKKDFKYFKENIYYDNGIKVIRYVMPLSFLHRTPNLYYRFLNLFASYIGKKIKRGTSYDAIHAHSFLSGGYLGIKLKDILGCGCVITEHTSKIITNSLNATERRILGECVTEADAFVCVSNQLKHEIEKGINSSKQMLVHHNMVNSIFKCDEKTHGNEFVIASIGNLIPLKRMRLLIESFCKAFNKDELVKLEIAGDGPERYSLEALIREEGRENQIVLHGQLSRKDVVDLLKRSSVMALLSEKETFGVSYIEALAMGNIIVGVDNGGANDIINASNGIIAHYSDPEEISKALRKTYENYLDYSPEEIIKCCQKKYGEEEFSNYYCQLYNNICTKDY